LVPWYLYVGFIAFVIAMLLIDLRFFHAEEHDPTPKESATWVGIWVTLALAFGGVVFVWKGTETGIEYFAGYLLEYSLSVDNMFVFVLIFTYFQVPFRYQHQVLFYGILGAMIFRGLFIAAGVSLINTFDWIIYIFGAFLIITAVRMAIGTEEVHPDENPILNFAKRRLPTTTKFDGQKLFTIENGKRLATPLLIVLLFIEMTDIVFAVDSIPAIFGITDDPFIILTSNVFAILGLRALYFLLAGVIDRFHLLKYGLAIVLAFVGTKMLLEAVHVEIPVQLSLLVIVVVLGITTVLSLLITARVADRPEAEKGAGIEVFAGEVNDPPDEASEENEVEEDESKEEAGG
jgi:tellurite resistance protein TerC